MTTLPQQYDFARVEKEVSALWHKHHVAIKATTQYDPTKPLFSFLEGPPTANAPPALHHVEVRVFKDVFCRFKHMQGFTVPRKGGWDCHGLPVEVQVEKKLGLTTKKAVLDYGIGKFTNECRTDVFTFIKAWEENTKRLGYWIDLDNPYRTLDNNYVESVWWSLKELHKKGLLYEGHKVVPYCPRCETPLSSHEVALGYEDVTETSITVKFKLKNAKNRFLLVWTTTPWTLPSNVCAAVNEKLQYAVVKKGGEEFVLAKELVNKYFDDPHIIEEFSGSSLVGKEYTPIFDYFVGKLDKPAWKIVHEDYVTTADGTGIVHQAPAFGEVDYESCKKHGFPFIQPVKEDGRFTAEVSDFAGKFVKDADEEIIVKLNDEEKLFKTEKYTHSYPFCWRCKTSLLYYAMNSWFIAVTQVRDRMVELNKDILWFPEHIKDGRFGKWIEGAKDWALSRTKFWGTPLPIWKCDKCSALTVIGSRKELQEHAQEDVSDLDLHKPFVDELHLECDCGGKLTRIPDVIDCWYDSGAAPFAQYHYPFENKALVEKSMPYQYIAEAIDQTRGWFYTLHVLSTILFDNIAYKRCAVGGLLHDDQGRKMSKSLGNIIKPDEIFSEVGVDAVRYLMCSYPLGEGIRFGKAPLKETVQPFFNTLWNSFYYVNTYLSRHAINGKERPNKLLKEDAWLISKTNTLIDTVTTNLDEGRFDAALGAINNFVTEDVSRFYIKVVRDRVETKDEALAYAFRYAFERVIMFLAPFTPYLAESMYQHFGKKKDSVHFDAWPMVEESSPDVEQKMSHVRDIIQATLAARELAKIGLRWPIQKLTIVTTDSDVRAAAEHFEELLLAQTNAKQVVIMKELPGTKPEIKADFRAIGKAWGRKTQTIVDTVLACQDASVYDLQKKQEVIVNIDGKNIRLTNEHLSVITTLPEGVQSAQLRTGGIVAIDTELTSELKAEGYARELTRHVQSFRKEAGLAKEQRIQLHLKMDAALDRMLLPHVNALQEKVGAEKITVSIDEPKEHFEHVTEAVIKEFTVALFFNVVGKK